MLAGPPATDVEVPAVVGALAGGRTVRAVWENESGGLTFELTGTPGRVFVKWAPASSGIDLPAEAARLSWVAPFTAVPRVLDHGGDPDGTWLLTEALPGETAVSRRCKRQPASTVEAIGEGLRAFHDALPADRCPFSWEARHRVHDVRRRAAGGLDRATWHAEHGRLTVDRALALLAEIPEVDRLVVCHGDACSPNTLVGADGRCTGHVDLGTLGVADRWADLAVATWSTEWNYGPGWQDRLLSAYGVTADPDRTRYYRLLWDLGP